MKEKGFTLVELLAVITILAIVTVLASYGISTVSNIIKNNIWENKVNIIENGAIRYGEDYDFLLKEKGSSKCAFMEYDVAESLYCNEVTVEYLLERNYIQTDERDSSNKKIITDDKGNVINDTIVYVWIENNLVYAKYIIAEE